MTPLISLSEYKAAIGQTSDDYDDRYEFALDAATQAILNFTDRDFATDEVTESRDFQVPDSININDTITVDIDDAQEIIEVGGLADSQWVTGSEGPAAAQGVITYLEIAHRRASSIAMGFTRNEDRFLQSPIRAITVTGTWGWPTVPADVKQAMVWAVDAIVGDVSDPTGALAAKGVAEVFENYVQQSAQQTPNDAADPLPSRVRALLTPYRRVSM